MYNFKILYLWIGTKTFIIHLVSLSLVMHLPEDGHVNGWNM